MLSVNKNYSLLNPSYLFPEMKRRVSEFSSKNLTSVIYNLGEGDTTQPLTSTVSKAMIRKIKNMSSGSDFMGYSDPLGQIKLRNTVVNYYKTFLKGSIQESEVFISDGAKADLFNIQTIFSTNIKIALQNPSYPVYIDSLVINGNAGTNNHLI